MGLLRAIAARWRDARGAASMELLVIVGLAVGSLAAVAATFGVGLHDALAALLPG